MSEYVSFGFAQLASEFVPNGKGYLWPMTLRLYRVCLKSYRSLTTASQFLPKPSISFLTEADLLSLQGFSEAATKQSNSFSFEF
jgi:hypothetical protein